MPHRGNALRRLLALLGVAIFASAIAAGAAQAESYGEITRFGKAGTGLGGITQATGAIGVDAADNSIFVVDSPTRNETFRIQEFSKNGAGQYEAVASNTFEPKDEGKAEELYDKVEGVAVDPASKKVFVLAAEERPFCEEEEQIKGKCKHNYEEFTFAASAVYAFNTVPTGTELTPVSGTGTNKGLVAGPAAFEPQSESYAIATAGPLLNPTGIAVDTAGPTHELIITGAVNRGEKNYEVEEEVGGKKVKILDEEPESTVRLERMSETGKTITERYTEPEVEEEPGEKSPFFHECGCVTSPVVDSTGHVYVGELESGIFEIPTPFSADTVPVSKVQTLPGIEFDAYPDRTENGGGLSIGEEGNVFAFSSVKLQPEGGCGATCQHFPGVTEFSSTFGELGYTGGQSELSGAGKCVIPLGHPTIAAGKNQDVFVLSPTPESKPTIIEFGPGGSGCPTAVVAAPTAKVENIPVPEAEAIAEGREVVLESTMREGVAQKVEWKFGDGAEETVTPDRGSQTPKVTHKFTKPGTLTIVEKVHTDDLAAPLLTVERKITIDAAPAVTTEAATEVGEATAKLNASVNPGNAQVTACEFEYSTNAALSEGIAKAPCATGPGNGTNPVAVSASVSGLALNQPYYFRISATNAVKNSKGTIVKFETTDNHPTKPIIPTVEGASNGSTSATLKAEVNSGGREVTKCEFRYGSGGYGSSVPCSPATIKSKGTVTATIEGLAPSTTYSYEIVATNELGTTTTTGVDFKTTAEETKTLKLVIPPSETPGGGVLPVTTAKAPTEPIVTIGGFSTAVTSSGSFPLKLSCPPEETSCSGTVGLKTAGAVVASAHLAKKKKKPKAAVLTLAGGSFTITGGGSQTLTLHLSSKGRELLAKAGVIHAVVTIVAANPAGGRHTTTVSLTLKPAPKKKHHK
jgi:PKD domain